MASYIPASFSAGVELFTGLIRPKAIASERSDIYCYMPGSHCLTSCMVTFWNTFYESLRNT